MELNNCYIKGALKNYLKTSDFEVLSCEGVSTDDVATGFLSAQLKARIKYMHQGKEGELNVFIKCLPESSYHKEIIVTNGGFRKEVIVFEEILNPYRKYLGDDIVPECYFAKPDEIIMMEDVSKKGFKNTELYQTMDLLHCKKTLEAMAKLHSLSFIVEEKSGRKLSELIPDLNIETIMSTDENHHGRKAVLVSFRVLKQVAQMFLGAEFSSATRQKAFDFLDNVFDKYKPSTKYANVMAHSDLWANNVLFSYGDKGNVKKACICDFQLATYKTPAFDILLFLYCCSDRSLREEHLKDLLKHYYQCLSKDLYSSGMDLEDKMTWADFESSFEEVRPMVLGQACLYLHFILIPLEILENVLPSPEKYKVFYEIERVDEVWKSMKNPLYRKRVLESLTEFIEYFDHE